MQNRVRAIAAGGQSEWPIPFSGIEYSIKLRTKADLAVAVMFLLMEHNHCHNFAVQTDGLVLHVSARMMKCLEELFHD